MKKLCKLFFLFSVAYLTPVSTYATLVDGLAAAWFFSGNAIDSSGNGNDGQVIGAQLAPDRNGNPDSAYSFDGVNDHISIGNNVKPALPLSVNLWFNADAIGRYPLFRNDRMDGGSFRNGVFLETSGSKLVMRAFSGFAVQSTRTGVITTNNVFATNEWNMFTAVFDGINDFRIYVNGTEENVVPTTGTGNSMTYSTANGSIGSVNNTANNAGVFTSNFFDGLIDDVRVYSRALSDQEIMQLVSAPSAVPIPPAVLLFGTGLLGLVGVARRRKAT